MVATTHQPASSDALQNMDTTTETGWSQIAQELHEEMLATLKGSTDVILLRDIEGRCL